MGIHSQPFFALYFDDALNITHDFLAHQATPSHAPRPETAND